MRRCYAMVMAALLMVLPWARRAAAQPMADKLPASTQVYVGWSPGAAMQSTMLAKMLADERLMDPWRRILQEMVLSIPDAAAGPKISDELPRLLEDLSSCEGCFAVVESRVDESGVGPQAILVVNLGARRKSFEDHFKPIHERLKELLGDQMKMMKLEDSWLWTKSAGDKVQFTWGFVGDDFVVFWGDHGDKLIPAILKGQVGKTLAGSERFKDCMGKVPGEGAVMLTAFVDLGVSLDLVKAALLQAGSGDVAALMRRWPAVLAQTGLDNLKAMGEKTVIEDGQFVTHTLLRTDGPPRGLLASLVQPGVDPGLIKCIPADALVAVALRADAGKLYDQIKAAATAVDPEDAAKSFNNMEAAAAGMGLPIQDALAPLGDQWVSYLAPSTGGSIFTGMTMVATVRDAAKLQQTMDTLTRVMTGMIGAEGRVTMSQYDVDGVTIHFAQLGPFGAPFSPAYAVAGDKLFVAIYPQLVEDAIRQSKADKSLADNPEFAAMTRRVGADGPLIYLSGPEAVRNIYPLALMAVPAAGMYGAAMRQNQGGAGIADFTMLLPSLQRLLQYVGTSGACLKVTPDGLLRTETMGNPLLCPLTYLDSVAMWAVSGGWAIGAAGSSDRAKGQANFR